MQERNHCLVFFKGLAALCVIFVHIEFPGSFGKIAKGAGGCAVLLFFIISGYSAYGSRAEMCPKLLRRFRRNLLLTLTAAGVYFAVTAYERITFCHDFKYWLRNLSQPKLYLRLFLLGDLDFIHGDPLWFMVALLYAYLVFWVIARFDLKKAACIAMPFFVLLRICIVTYKNTHHTDWHTCSNLLVSALPMMLTGYWIAHHREKLKKLPDAVLTVSCLLAAVSLAVTALVKVHGVDIAQPFRIWTAVSAFGLSLRKPHRKICRPVGLIGGALSLHVYLWHFPLILLLYDPVSSMLSEKAFAWGFPVLIATAAVIVLTGRLLRRITKKAA